MSRLPLFWSIYFPTAPAEAGYLAAALIAYGYDCNPNALTGTNGLIRQIAPVPNVKEAMAGLGEVYLCETTSCKPYPFGFVAYACMDCCDQLTEISRNDGEQLQRIDAWVSPGVKVLGGNAHPKDYMEAKVAVPYLIQMAILTPENRYRSLEDHFRPDEFARASLEVTLDEDEQLKDEQARMRGTFTDGTSCEVSCEAAPGSASRPMSHEKIQEKFLALAGTVMSEKEAEQLRSRMQEIEREESIDTFLVSA